eukprot:179405-Amphidinium_carterae.1
MPSDTSPGYSIQNSRLGTNCQPVAPLAWQDSLPRMAAHYFLNTARKSLSFNNCPFHRTEQSRKDSA